MTNRKLRYSGLGIAALTVGMIAACSSSDGETPAAGGKGSGGGAQSGGGSGNATSSGGSSTAGGTATGGGPAAAGSGTGGAGAGFACSGGKLSNPLITGFTSATPNATSTGNFTLTDGVQGGTFSYQPAALALTLTTDTAVSLNVKGNIKDYDGFGMYFNSCQDASAFTGVSFKIKGNAGSTGKINFRVQTNATTAIDAKNSKGSCEVPPGTTDTYPLCHPSAMDIPVTAAGATVTVNFSQLLGGVPVSVVTGSDVVGLEWAFAWTPGAAPGTGGSGAGGAASATGGSSSGGAAAGGRAGSASGGSAPTGAGGTGPGPAPAAGPYDADVTIDDIVFIGGPPVTGTGGSGAGGSSSGGSSSGGAPTGAGGSSAGTGGKAGGG